MRRKPCWMRIVSLVTAVLLALPLPAMAQNGTSVSPQDAQSRRHFSQEELAQLVAPIALYPDELVAQILMASTYPLEIVEADRWVQQHRDLKGENLARALEEKNWDPSVKSLVNFPSVLSMMSQKLEVTAKMGDAFLTQEQEMMSSIQTLRKKAYDAGNLTATPEQKVIVEKETIVIQPANPQVVYVPAYDPFIVYGPWMYPAYPPYPYYAYPLPAYGVFGFAAGITIGLAWGYAWGWCNWYGGSVYVNVWRNENIHNAYINRHTYERYYHSRGMADQHGEGRWRHDASHRKGVAYRDPATAMRYGQSPARASQAGRDARGYGDSRVMPYPARTAPGQGGRGSTDRTAGTPGGAPPPAGLTPPGGKIGHDQRGTGSSERTGGGVSGGKTPAPSAPRGTVPAPGQSGAGQRGGPQDGARSGIRVDTGAAPAPSGSRESGFSRFYGDGDRARAASERGQASRQFSGEGSRQGGFSGAPAPKGGYSGAPPRGGYSGAPPRGGFSGAPPRGGYSGGVPGGGGFSGGGPPADGGGGRGSHR